MMHVLLWHARSPAKQRAIKNEPAPDSYGELDVRRRAQIGSGKAEDYNDDLVLMPNPDFDLNATIFSNLEGAPQRYIMNKKLAVRMHWSDSFIDKVLSTPIPAVVPPDRPILDFMNNDCDFSCEHADGSFWDHLRFCYDYSSVHYPKQSPRVMLLHSILGVGTNLFPCHQDNIPALEKLVDPNEMAHISAFPSILRLILNGSLLAELKAAGRPLSELRKLSYHRVIDNAQMSLEGEMVWVHLNYQLMHLMDFLPGMEWQQNIDDPQLQVFIQWLDYLKQQEACGPMANVNMDVVANVQSVLDLRYGITQLKAFIFQRTVGKYSEAIHHSLGFELHWAESS